MKIGVKTIVLIILIAVSLLVLIPSGKEGVKVTRISVGSACSDVLKKGDVITIVNEIPVTSPQDFYDAVSKGNLIRMLVNGKPTSCQIEPNKTLDVKVERLGKVGLKFGIDVRGGVEYRIPIEESESRQRIINLIKERIKLYNLPDTYVESNGKIKIITTKDLDIEKLIEPGRVECRVVEEVELLDGQGKFYIDDDEHIVKFEDGKFFVDDTQREINESFDIDGIEAILVNGSEESFTISLLFFSNDDVEEVVKGYSQISYEPQFGIYRYAVATKLSDEAAKRFKIITKKVEREFTPGGFVLKARFTCYLDGKEISSLRIPVEIAGKEFYLPSIMGFSTSRSEAIDIKKELTVVLKSGYLPNDLVIEDVMPISPKVSVFRFLLPLPISILIIFALLFAISKNIKITTFVILLMLCEMLVVLGSLSYLNKIGRMIVINRQLLYGFILALSLSLIQFITTFFVRKKVIRNRRIKILVNVLLLMVSITFLAIQSLNSIGIVLTVTTLIGITVTKPLFSNSLSV